MDSWLLLVSVMPSIMPTIRRGLIQPASVHGYAWPVWESSRLQCSWLQHSSSLNGSAFLPSTSSSVWSRSHTSSVDLPAFFHSAHSLSVLSYQPCLAVRSHVWICRELTERLSNHGAHDLVLCYRDRWCGRDGDFDTLAIRSRGILRLGQLLCRDRVSTTSADERSADRQCHL